MVRMGLVVFGAVGFCVALATVSSADVVDPESAYQPASTGLLREAPAPVTEAARSQAEGSVDQTAGADPLAAEPTPAPESQVRQAPRIAPVAAAAATDERAVRPNILHPFKTGLRHIESYLGRVVSACQVGMGSGTGGPVVVLAVLSVAVALARRRVLWARSATDEDAPEFLYAWEISPPG